MSNNSYMRRTKSTTIIIGVLMLLLGLAFLVWPGGTTEFFVLMCGWGFVIAGIATFAGYFAKSEGRSAWDIVLAVCEFVLGILILIFPFFFAGVFVIFIGIVVIATGIFDIMDAISLRDVKGSLWGLWLALGIITLIFGLCMFAYPIIWAVTMIWLAGVVLVFDGITEIIAGAMMKE